MTKTWLRKGGKLLGWLMAALITVLVVAIMLLYTKPVQSFLSQQAEDYLQELVGSPVKVGGIGLEFPLSLELHSLELYTPTEDSLLYIGELAVDVELRPLFQQQVMIEHVSLNQVSGHLVTTDNSSNFQFLLDAFQSEDSTTVNAAADTNSNAWIVQFNRGNLTLEDIELYYQDDPSGLLLDLQLGRAQVQTNEVDLIEQHYLIEEFTVANTTAVIQLHETVESSDTTSSTSELIAACDKLQVRESRIQFLSDSLSTEANISNLTVIDLDTRLTEETIIKVAAIDLQARSIAYDKPNIPVKALGLDPNHLQLKEINLQLQDLLYQPDSLSLKLQYLALQEKSGLQLEELRTQLIYTPSRVQVEGFTLNTLASTFQAHEATFVFPIDSTTLYQSIDLKTEGLLSISELLLLAPQLQEYRWFQGNQNARLSFGATLSGEDNSIQATRLDCRGPGLQLVSSGQLHNIQDLQNIAGALDLQHLSVLPNELLPFLPKGSVPDYIKWPEQIIAAGELSYRNGQLSVNFNTREDRLQQRTWSEVSLRGTATQLQDNSRTALDMRLDSLMLSRPSILAYLPPKTIPADYQLPSYLKASGSLSGPLNDLALQLRLALPENQTYAQVSGQLREALRPELLNFDIDLQDIALRQNEILPLLPGTLLPAALQVPDLRIQAGRLSGRADSLHIHLPINSSNGNWLLSGSYQPEQVDLRFKMEQVQAAAWLQGSLRDSIEQLGLQALKLNAHVTGQLEPSLDLRLETQIQEEERGQLLNATASAQDSTYQIDFSFAHTSLQGQGNASYDRQNNLDKVAGELEISTLDLNYWGVSERPLSAKGRIELSSTGLNTEQLDARLLIEDLLLRGGGAAAYTDSLLISANLLEGKNNIKISGDVLEGYLRGQFNITTIPGELERFLQSHLRKTPLPVKPDGEGQQMEMALRVKNPRPFITGIIPGLTALSEMDMLLEYQDQGPALLFELSLPELAYAGLSLHDMQMEANGGEEQLQASINWQDVSYGEDIALGQTTIAARSVADGLDIALQAFTADSLRHQLALNWKEEGDAQYVQFKPEQRINFSPWTIPADNQISWQDSSLNITNWKLGSESSSITLNSPRSRDLLVQFEQVDLTNLSRFINTEEELLGGELSGEVLAEEVLANPALAMDVAIQQLSYYQDKLGNLDAQIQQQANEDFTIDLQLEGAENSLSANGLYLANNELDLLLQLNRLQLSSLEPFTFGYLRQAEGFLTGACSVKGSADAPKLAGALTFEEAELTISLLGSRLFLDDQQLTFEQELIQFDDFTILDPNGNIAKMNGQIEIKSIDDIRLNLNAITRDFLAVESTATDNDLFYGKLSVDAEADITGSVANPRVVINATPSSDSRLTYAYSLAQQASLETTQGIVTFAESYEWEERLAYAQNDSSSVNTNNLGAYIETNLTINDKLLVEVLVDPITNQTFKGRGEGAITFIQRPSGQQEMTGQISLATGNYEMALEGIQRYDFRLEPGSTVFFTGNPLNPQLDLTILNAVTTSPLPLVKVFDPTSSTTGLRRRETFEVVLGLTGDLQGMDITADILYPEDQYGNEGLSAVENALDQLRQDQTRTYTTAITLVTLNSFVLPTLEVSDNPQQDIVNGLAGAVGNALSSLVNNRLGGVQFDVGIENYETASGEQNYNVRLSLQKSFFDDRLIVSVDGVTNTAEDASTDNTTAATYLDNVSVAYLLDEDGTLRIKLFNDRDENVFVGGNVMRVGGRLVFNIDFDHFFWEKQ